MCRSMKRLYFVIFQCKRFDQIVTVLKITTESRQGGFTYALMYPQMCILKQKQKHRVF